MANDLMIPETGLPAHIIDKAKARAINDDAMAGIGTGFPPRLKLSGKQFALVDGNGEERPYPPAKMVAGADDNMYLPVIVLRAKKEFSKSWYASKYNPNATEFTAPDCSSSDGIRPDANSPSPQSETCAKCPHNVFGTGTDMNGNATKGKACADTKILAVLVPGYGIHSFKIPAASLKNWGLFIKQLSGFSIPVTNIQTLVGFDLTQSNPVLRFVYGGPLAPDIIAALAAKAESSEVMDIIGTPSTALPAPAAAPPVIAPPLAAADLGVEVVVPEIVEPSSVEEVKVAESAKKKAEPAPAVSGAVTDADLMAMFNIKE